MKYNLHKRTNLNKITLIIYIAKKQKLPAAKSEFFCSFFGKLQNILFLKKTFAKLIQK